MKLKLTARFRVALGQVGLMVSIILIGVLIGIVPDRQGTQRQGRAALAEAIAMHVHGFMKDGSARGMADALTTLVERNPDLISAGVRKHQGQYLVTVGEHAETWKRMSGSYSTDSQIRVPLLKDDRKPWGEVELRFKAPSLMARVAQSEIIPFILYMGLLCFGVFYAYLSQMLKHLDPSRAVPTRVRAALDTLAEGLIVLDMRGEIVLANQALANIVGRDVDRMLGLNVWDIPWQNADGSRLGHEDSPWLQCLTQGEAVRQATVYLDDLHGLRRTFQVNCTPVMGGKGKHGGALISFDDITQLEVKKQELAKARDHAEAANQAKSDFLANMSHEIRTPLNAILGFTDVLRRGYGRENLDPRKHLSTIHSSGQHLLRLINDILDLSKVEAGRLEVELIRCAPHVVVREVLQVLKVKADEKGIDLGWDADQALPETIETDPARLRQIVTNLVGNAIKFTQEGGVKVLLSMTRDSAGAPLYRIDVRDSGIGMNAEQLDRIFDPFSQADSSVTRKFGGTGLGLTISRRFARALGGDVAVQSIEGQGSTFSITVQTGDLSGVPVLDPQTLQAEDFAAESEDMTWEFDQQRILVVDDGEENRELLTVVLKEVGLEVETAENGEIGARMALTNGYSLVLMDMQMPVMDGYTATKLLREKGNTTPIYALTANAMKGFERECLAVGCSGYLTKPIEIDVLFEALAKELGGRRVEKQQAKVDIGAPSQPSTPSNAPFSMRLESTLPMDRPEFRRLVEMFVPRLRTRLEEMEQHLVNEEFSQLAKLAHWLKGTGGTVGFEVFTEPAIRLEEAAKESDPTLAKSALVELVQLSNNIVLPEPAMA